MIAVGDNDAFDEATENNIISPAVIYHGRCGLGHLSTHVLDTSAGKPAHGVAWTLFRVDGTDRAELASGLTNSDGRTDGPLLEGERVVVGTYELVFQVADYFKALGTPVSDPPFLDEIPLRFSIFDADQKYHVPLLVSPYSYSTYRGS